MVNPFDTLRMVLLDRGVSADYCGVLRPGQVTKRPHKVLTGLDLAACGFRGDDLNLVVVQYDQPKPPAPKPAPAKVVSAKPEVSHSSSSSPSTPPAPRRPFFGGRKEKS